LPTPGRLRNSSRSLRFSTWSRSIGLRHGSLQGLGKVCSQR
jgi:hypothetical protein